MPSLEGVGQIAFYKYGVTILGMLHDVGECRVEVGHRQYAFLSHTALFEAGDDGVAVVFVDDYGGVAALRGMASQFMVELFLTLAKLYHAGSDDETVTVFHHRQNVKGHLRPGRIAPGTA